MNPQTTTQNFNLRVLTGTAQALIAQAHQIGVNPEEMVSAILDAEFPYDAFTDDEIAALILSQVGILYPDRWSELEPVYNRHQEAVDQMDSAEQARFDKRLAETVSLTLPPAMVEFMRETGRLFPELWDIFVGECVVAILDGLPHYLDNAFNFESPADRRKAFRQVEEALAKYRASSVIGRGARTLGSQLKGKAANE